MLWELGGCDVLVLLEELAKTAPEFATAVCANLQEIASCWIYYKFLDRTEAQSSAPKAAAHLGHPDQRRRISLPGKTPELLAHELCLKG